jgi:hypothetical protein
MLGHFTEAQWEAIREVVLVYGQNYALHIKSLQHGDEGYYLVLLHIYDLNMRAVFQTRILPNGELG